MNNKARILVAEFIGTAVLMMGGPGTAILAGDRVGTLGIALAFGLSLLVMAYVIGPVSGCHINPAVTLGAVLARVIEVAVVPFYVIGQLLGAAFGAVVIFFIANGDDSFTASGNFAANGWGGRVAGGNPYGVGAVALVEIVLTAVLVLAVLSTTNRNFSVGMGGLTVGLTLTLIHLISIPVDNTSVNPARSLGAALFAGSDAWVQIWAFIVFPLIGAVVGVAAWLALNDKRVEDTMLGRVGLIVDARDSTARVTEVAVGRIEEVTERVTDR
jgi:aquaporin Z